MKTLDRFILKTYLGPMFLTLFIVVFIFLIQFLWLYIDEIAGKGLPWNVLLEFIAWLSITFIPMSLPLSTLLSGIMTMGNLGENNELLAMKSSGISLQRVLLPLYGLTTLVVIFSFLMSSDFAPGAYLKMRVMFSDIRNKNPELSIPTGIFYNDIENYSIRVDSKDNVTGVLKGLMIYDHSKRNGNTSVMIADSGYIKQTHSGDHIIFKAFNGSTYVDSESITQYNEEKKYPFELRTFKDQTAAIPINQESSGASESLFSNIAKAKSKKSLEIAIDSVKKDQSYMTSAFESNLYTSAYFKSYKEMDTTAMFRDALKYPVNVDSVFNAMGASEKTRTIEMAAINAKSAADSWYVQLINMDNASKSIDNLIYEWHLKITLSLSCLIFFFIGAPLGSIIRKGGLGMPIVISVFFFVFYWVIDTICRKSVQNGVWNPVFGAWFPTIILAPIAIFLTYKSNTDSQLFNPDKYKRFFDMITGKVENLVDKINLDKIKPLYTSDITVDKQQMHEVNSICQKFIDKYKSMKLFQDRAEMVGELSVIQEKYYKMLEKLASIDDDERLRTVLKTYPALNAEDYRTTIFAPIVKTLIIVFFPALLVYRFKIRLKNRSLYFILNEIQTVNNIIIHDNQ